MDKAEHKKPVYKNLDKFSFKQLKKLRALNQRKLSQPKNNFSPPPPNGQWGFGAQKEIKKWHKIRDNRILRGIKEIEIEMGRRKQLSKANKNEFNQKAQPRKGISLSDRFNKKLEQERTQVNEHEIDR